MGSKPRAFVYLLFNLHILFGSSSIFTAAENKNKNKTMNMCYVLCGITLRLFFCYHRQTPTFTVTNALIIKRYMLPFPVSTAIAIDGILYFTLKTIFIRIVLFSLFVYPIMKNTLEENGREKKVNLLFRCTLTKLYRFCTLEIAAGTM